MRRWLIFVTGALVLFYAAGGCSRKQEESTDQAPPSAKQEKADDRAPRPAERQTEDDTTLTKVGDHVPAFSVTTIDGERVDTATAVGKVLVVNFFATWCPPCQRELPELQSRIWKRYRDRELTVVCVGREHSAEELTKYRQEKGFELPMAPDPERDVYGKFATRFIPRTYVVGKDGKIKHQVVGFDPQDFSQIIEVIEHELAL